MKKAKYKQKKQFIQQEKKLEKKHYRIITGLIVFFIAYYFIEPKTMGHDVRYSIYILLLPTIIGILILGIYRREFLIHRFATSKGFFPRIFLIFFFFIQGILFSYLSFGQIARIGWDYYNYRVAQKNPEETFICPVTEFQRSHRSGSANRINFKFNDQHASVIVGNSTIKKYKNENPEDYYLKIRANKSLWNYYVVNDWTIKYK